MLVKPWEGLALDRRSLAVFRVALGFSLLTNLLLRWLDVREFYTENGTLPLSLLRRVQGWAYTFHVEPWLGILWAAGAVAATALILGIRPRIAVIVSWVLLLSLQGRNPLVLHAGDQVLLLLTFWSMFLPLTGRGTVVSPASVAFILQLCVVYWLAAAGKMHPVWLTEASAVYQALHLDVFATPLGLWLRDRPAIAGFATTATMALEALGPFLALTPWPVVRLAAVLLFVGFHLGLAASMRLGTFPWFCIAGWLALIPGFVWDRLGWRQNSELYRPSMAGSALATAAMLVIGTIIAVNPPRPRPGRASPAFRVLQSMGFIQRWGMFAPYPWTEDVWLDVDGERRAHPNSRWLGYSYRLWGRRWAPYRVGLARWMCRQSGRDSLRIAFLVETTPPPGSTPGPLRREVLWEGECPGFQGGPKDESSR